MARWMAGRLDGGQGIKNMKKDVLKLKPPDVILMILVDLGCPGLPPVLGYLNAGKPG